MVLSSPGGLWQLVHADAWQLLEASRDQVALDQDMGP